MSFNPNSFFKKDHYFFIKIVNQKEIWLLQSENYYKNKNDFYLTLNNKNRYYQFAKLIPIDDRCVKRIIILEEHQLTTRAKFKSSKSFPGLLVSHLIDKMKIQLKE